MRNDSDALAASFSPPPTRALNAAAGDLTLALCALDGAGAVDALTLVRAVECEAEAVTAALKRFEERRG